MNKAANIFSWVLSPILIPTYSVILSLWATVLSVLPLGIRWNVVLMTALITAFLPALAIFLLYKFKAISDPGLNKRGERFVPYGVTCVCYLLASWYLFRIHAPYWMAMFMVAGAVAALVCVTVNIWWKISAHMAALGGLVGLMFRIMSDGVGIVPMWIVISVGIFLLGILGSSRLLLERHTFWQVIAGTAVGFASVYLLTIN